MGSVVRGYMVSCHECKSGEACPCIIIGEVVGSTIDEVIREALGSGEVIDRVVLEVGGEFIGFYDPGTNHLVLLPQPTPNPN
jgi:hypothetical protein